MSTHDRIEKEEAIQEAAVQEALEEISRVEHQSTVQKQAYNELEEFIQLMDNKSILSRLPLTKDGREYRKAKQTLEALDFENRNEELV
ncbi:hypothetical protein HOI83_04520 [Candidatus Uhrbacteria bacterium]|jgi:hypothetical protein|nr:hypothetical protein [Candidatus Uhrbacteria bacterium]